jgi:hypothetical protein
MGGRRGRGAKDPLFNQAIVRERAIHINIFFFILFSDIYINTIYENASGNL